MTVSTNPQPERLEVAMTSTHPQRKEKIKHELREMLTLFCLYLAFFFCALETFEFFLLDEYQVRYRGYAFALINALVITKIMIGEYAKLGKRQEGKSLFVSAIWKPFVFSLLVFAFHIVEAVIKRLIHGVDLAKASHELRLDRFATRGIVVCCIFIPLSAFQEFRCVMGVEEFRNLAFGSGGGKQIDRTAQ